MQKDNIEILEKNLYNLPRFFLYKDLNRAEKLTINIIYIRNWRKDVKKAKVDKLFSKNFEIYFKELHAIFYTKVLKGSNFVSVYRLILNFFISRTNENLRVCLNSYNPYNLTSFVLAIRSQIELNALLLRFVKDNDYLKKFVTLNEDRKLVKELDTVINVNTLVRNLDKYSKKEIGFTGYEEIYNDLSLLLHPNPSAIRFYAQAFKESEEDESIPSPKLSHFFDNPIDKTKHTDIWFENNTVMHLTFVFHFIHMLNKLPVEDFYINEHEKGEMENVALYTYLESQKKNLLEVANEANREGKDIGQAIQEFLNKHTK